VNWNGVVEPVDVLVIINTLNVEPVMLFENQPAFALYDFCDNLGFSQYETYTVGVLGKENIEPDAGRIYYKVGYCSVILKGEFAVATTFLPPGYCKTPEYGLLLNSTSLPRIAKENLIAKVTVEGRTESDLLYSNDNEEAKWFHQNLCLKLFIGSKSRKK